jgi:hypothetical protein
MNTKNPFQSKTIWGLVITLIGILANKFKLPVDKAELHGLVDFLALHWEDILEVVGILLAAWGRFRASFPLSFRGASSHPLWAIFIGLLFTSSLSAGPKFSAAFFDRPCILNDSNPALMLGEFNRDLMEPPGQFPDFIVLIPDAANPLKPRVKVFSGQGLHLYLDTLGELSGFATFSGSLAAPPVAIGF